MTHSIKRLPALFLILLGLAACSSNLREVVGQPPQVSLDGLHRQDDSVIVELALRNVNDEALKLESISFTLRVDERQLGEGRRSQALAISARGREVLRIALPAAASELERLDALATGRVPRLPWNLDVKLVLSGERDRRATAEGWLHAVPGQPNRFR